MSYVYDENGRLLSDEELKLQLEANLIDASHKRVISNCDDTQGNLADDTQDAIDSITREEQL